MSIFVQASVSKDVAFPYMMDARHAPDTLFIFFESDFRWRRDDCLEPSEWLPLVAEVRSSTGAPRGGASSPPRLAAVAKQPPKGVPGPGRKKHQQRSSLKSRGRSSNSPRGSPSCSLCVRQRVSIPRWHQRWWSSSKLLRKPPAARQESSSGSRTMLTQRRQSTQSQSSAVKVLCSRREPRLVFTLQ